MDLSSTNYPQLSTMKNCSLRMFNLLVIFTLFTTSNASCGDLCLLNFDSSDKERTNCIKVLCERYQGPWNPAVKQYFMAEKRYQESGKSKESKENLIDNYQKRSAGTCVALCRGRYSSAKERIACVDAGCRAFFRDRCSSEFILLRVCTHGYRIATIS